MQDKRDNNIQATVLTEICMRLECFMTPGGEMYAHFPVADHHEVHPLRSTAVKDWLTYEYAKRQGRPPSRTTVEGFIAMLQGRARYEGTVREVFTRVAWVEEEQSLYLDLGDKAWRAVRITRTGWQVVNTPLVRFRRPLGMLPLPEPTGGMTLDALRPFLNFGTEENFCLAIGWLIGALHPTGPYAILALHGEQGSGKTSFARRLRALIDPVTAITPKQPRDSADLTLKAHNNWVVALDNMSSMPDWLSDDLCRLATGAGDSKRQLYADSDEVIFQAKRPIVLNGIEELATRGDLLDRAVIVSLPVISESNRKSDHELEAAFNAQRPYLLGALLDIVVIALRDHTHVKLAEKPRMADFAIWVTAAEKAIGWKDGDFLRAYKNNSKGATVMELEASPVASAIRQLMDSERKWSGSATDLLHELTSIIGEDNARRLPGWPKTARPLSGKLKRLAPSLRGIGLNVSIERDSSGSAITITREAKALTTGRGSDGNDAKLPGSYVFPPQKKEEEKGKASKIASFASSPQSKAGSRQTSPNTSEEDSRGMEDEEDWPF